MFFNKKMVNLFNGLISIIRYEIIVIITILIKKHKRNFIKIYCILIWILKFKKVKIQKLDKLFLLLNF
jgi:hypothetical protein